MECGYLPIFSANSIDYVKPILTELMFSAIVLTGGNDLYKYGGDALERDKAEQFLLKYAIEKKIPLVGVCRGMQLIQDYFGVSLRKINNHVGVLVDLRQKILGRYSKLLSEIKKVKSYHHWGTCNSVDELRVIAEDDNAIVMAIEHVSYPILGIMWHPERDTFFKKYNKQLFRSLIEAKV